MARTALKNKQHMMYSLLGEPQPVYLRDSEGNVVTTEVDGVEKFVEAGFSVPLYGEPVSFCANIMPVGSESYARGNVAIQRAFGLDISEYDALIVTNKGEFPFTETTVIWHESEPQYKELRDMVLLDTDGDVIGDTSTDAISVPDMTVIDDASADYLVKRVASSQNITLYLLNRMNRNEST